MVGIPALPAALVHGAVALAGVWIVWRVWSRQSDPLFRTAALVTATMLTSPYMYMYDQPMLIAGVAWAVTRGLNEKGLAILYAASFYCFAQMLSETRLINLMPVMPIGLLMMLYRESGETARLTALWQGLRMRAGLAR
jgi:hypothetical protein